MPNLDTKKIITHIVEEGGTIIITIKDLGDLPKTIEVDGIRPEHVCVNSVLSNPSAQIADWKVVTGTKSLTIGADLDDDRENAISGSTDMTLYLCPTSSLGETETLVIETPMFYSLPYTQYNSDLTPNHVCVKSVLTNPSAQTADWKINTNSGSFTISSDSENAIDGSTRATLYFTVQTA